MEEARSKAEEWGVQYVETSAKTRANVDKVRSAVSGTDLRNSRPRCLICLVLREPFMETRDFSRCLCCYNEKLGGFDPGFKTTESLHFVTSHVRVSLRLARPWKRGEMSLGS